MESNNSSRWTNIEDFKETVSSLSKLKKHTLRPVRERGYVLNSSPFEYVPEVSRPGEVGMGRGRYMDCLAKKFAEGERRAELDRKIHDDLKKINGAGYSNDIIEERFGTHDAYSLLETNGDMFSNADVSEIKNSFHPNNFDEAEKLQNGEKTPDLERDQAVGNEEKKEVSCAETSSIVSSQPKTFKKRRCRNVVVLGFAGKMNNPGPKLKAPHEYQGKRVDMKPDNKKNEEETGEFRLSNDDFPALS